jgi:hypothetical protein
MKGKGVSPMAMLLALSLFPLVVAPAAPEPVKLELKLVHIFDGAEPTHIFVIGDSGFRTVESLKGFLSALPPGSEITWAPGCARFGKEPLLSSGKDLQAFTLFLKQKGISLMLIPSG